MSSYAVAYVRRLINPSPEIGEYLRRISDTMDPFGGRFLVHDGKRDVVEGNWPGGLIIIEFPDSASAHAWWDSPAYQEILPFRANNIEMDIVLAEGVPDGYRGEDAVAKLPEAMRPATSA